MDPMLPPARPGHRGFESRLVDAAVPKNPPAIEKLRSRGGQSAAFTHREVLDGVEAVDTDVADSPATTPAILRIDRVRGVLDDRKSETHDLVHGRRTARVVHNHDRARAPGPAPLDESGGD